MKSEKGELASELMEIALTKLKIADILANNRHDQLNQHDIDRIAFCISTIANTLQLVRNDVNI